MHVEKQEGWRDERNQRRSWEHSGEEAERREEAGRIPRRQLRAAVVQR